MSLPLKGIRVLDLSRMLPGPFCTQILADYGAEVIKVEDRSGDPGRWASPFIGDQSALFCAFNRNKKSITLDLKRGEAQAVLKRLAAASDVLLEVFRPGVMDKFGLSYDELSSVNPGLIYCSMSGYGASGPLSKSPAHDLNILSLAGVAGLTGTASGTPGMSPIQLAGLAGGALYAVSAILMAIINRQKTGLGQFCDVSMLDGSISMLAHAMGEWSGSGRLPRRGGEFLTGGYAFYQIYETGDKRFVSLGAIENKFWRIFCERIGRPEYIDMQWDMERQEEMKAGIQTIMKQKTQKEWVQIFADVEICFTPVLNLDEVYEHPQVKAREMMMRMPDINNSGKDMVVPGLPIKFSATPGEVKLKFPELGEHTSEVLQGVGYTTEEIELFKINGIV